MCTSSLYVCISGPCYLITIRNVVYLRCLITCGITLVIGKQFRKKTKIDSPLKMRPAEVKVPNFSQKTKQQLKNKLQT